MTPSPQFAIVGGGIGGLTLAIALQRKGFSVTVYEQAPAFKPLGAGLALAANAMKAFAEIGIETEILKQGKVLKEIIIKDHAGDLLTRTDAEQISKKVGAANNFTIHRADLHAVLVKQLLPYTIVFGKACVNFENTPSGVTLFFQDGTQAIADAAVAADGIHSIFRRKLVPNSEPRYAGYTCWRAVIDAPPTSINLDETSETWGPGSRFGLVPLTNDRLYWFACANAPMNDVVMKSFDIQDLMSYFKDFHSPIPEIIAATKQEQLIWGDIIDLKPLEHFAFGNVVLLGDAAHATTPNLGQGACMAIEDAVVLSNCLARGEQPVAAFQQFEGQRLARTRKITLDSRQLGRVAQVRNPWLVGLRNMVLRATPARVAERQMKYLYDVSFS